MQTAQPRIALVDDDMSVRKALGRLLSACSFDIQTYGSARDFLNSLDHDAHPQCLVVDLHMPEVSGLDLQKYLTSLGVKIPTIVITAYNEPGINERCRAAGARAFLLKPIHGDILIDAINAATQTTAPGAAQALDAGANGS